MAVDLQNFEDIVEACQVVVACTNHTPGIFGCTYERLSVITAGDKQATGEEATVSLELQAFVRTMKRNKTWGARLCNYIAEAANDDTVMTDYDRFLRCLQKKENLNIPFIEECGTFVTNCAKCQPQLRPKALVSLSDELCALMANLLGPKNTEELASIAKKEREQVISGLEAALPHITTRKEWAELMLKQLKKGLQAAEKTETVSRCLNLIAGWDGVSCLAVFNALMLTLKDDDLQTAHLTAFHDFREVLITSMISGVTMFEQSSSWKTKRDNAMLGLKAFAHLKTSLDKFDIDNSRKPVSGLVDLIEKWCRHVAGLKELYGCLLKEEQSEATDVGEQRILVVKLWKGFKAFEQHVERNKETHSAFERLSAHMTPRLSAMTTKIKNVAAGMKETFLAALEKKILRLQEVAGGGKDKENWCQDVEEGMLIDDPCLVSSLEWLSKL